MEHAFLFNSHRPDSVGSKAYGETLKGSPVCRNSEGFFAHGHFLKQFLNFIMEEAKALLPGQRTDSIVHSCAQYYIRPDAWGYIFHLHTELFFSDKAFPLALFSN